MLEQGRWNSPQARETSKPLPDRGAGIPLQRLARSGSSDGAAGHAPSVITTAPKRLVGRWRVLFFQFLEIVSEQFFRSSGLLRTLYILDLITFVSYPPASLRRCNYTLSRIPQIYNGILSSARTGVFPRLPVRHGCM